MKIYPIINNLLNSGGRGVVITVTQATSGSPAKTGFKLLLTDKGELSGTVGGGNIEQLAVEEARKILISGVSQSLDYDLSKIGMKCGGKVSLFFEYLSSRQPFVLFGGGHVAQALAPILESLGYAVTVFDNRKDIITKHETVPGRDSFLGDYNDISPMRDNLSRGKCCFIASHGHLFDQVILKQAVALDIEYAYLGMIGSRRKIAETRKAIEAEGLRIPEPFFAPVGLPIGGDTAEEIAVSIAAQVLAVKYGKTDLYARES